MKHIAMPRLLFTDVVEEWPRHYIAGACSSELERMHREMRRDRFLWIRGERVPVVFSDASPLGNTVQDAVATLTRQHERN